MALNPVETMNTFSGPLSEELRNRSKSMNLVRTRTPFLRFTTAAIMDDVATKLTQLGSTNAGKFAQYQGYRFFTLGLHGYSQLNYSISDLYGSQGNSGQVIGTTYKGNDQRLVRTFGGQLGGEAANNYPPPGITSATVERVRNGNVLKFTVETQCYTQEQLEMLDIVCYVPGMTCVLEWGSLATTPTGVKSLEKTLDFRNTDVAIGAIQFALTGPRSGFIDYWCKPNDYNYDWVVANIANIKTTLEDNIYKTTIVAYGRADNIMYLSAYATTNPQKQETDISTSLTNFFKLNQDFSNILKEDINGSNTGLIKFTNPYDRAELLQAMPGAQETGQANDTGLEDTYFMTIDYFVNRILNGPVRNIIQAGLSYSLTYVLSPEPTYVGWNENLRSTSPEVMIIYNKEARDKNKPPQERIDATLALLSSSYGAARDIGRLQPPTDGGTDPVIQKLDTSEDFKNAGGDNAGAALITKGIWLNSKAIQAAFINARTVMEALESLLRNMNAATEGYWDLKLYYDDDAQAFRIIDDNLRMPKANAKIYEFNKRLTNTNNDVIGPDVLSIELKTDYPKLLFSQLAVAGINGGLDNLASSPDAKDVNFVRQTSVGDIFAKKQSQLQPATPSPESTPRAGAGTPWASLLSSIDSSATITSLGANPGLRIRAFNTAYDTLQGGSRWYQVGTYAIPDGSQRFPNDVPPGVVSIISTVFSNPNLLDANQANDIKRRLEAENLTQDQSAVITELFAQRSIAIITRDKQREIDKFEEAFNYAKDTKDQNGNPLINPAILARDTGPVKDAVRTKIIENRDQLISQVRNQVSTLARTGAGPTPPPPATSPGQIGGGAVAGALEEEDHNMALPAPPVINRTSEFTLPVYKKRRERTLFIVCHHTAGYDLDTAIRTLRDVRQLAYNFIVDLDGTIYKLVEADNCAQHAYEANACSPSISLVGYNSKAVADRAQTDRRQMNAAVTLGRWMQDRFSLPVNAVYGHGEIAMPREKEAAEGQYLAAILRNNQAPPPYPLAAFRFIDPETKKEAPKPKGVWTKVREAGFVIGSTQRVDWQQSGTQNTDYFRTVYEEPLKKLTGNQVAQDFLRNIDSIKVNVNSQSLTLRQSVQGTANVQAITGVNTLGGELTLLGAVAEANIRGQEEVRSVLSRIDGLLPAEAAYIVQQNLFEFFPDKMRQKMSISGATGVNPNYAHAWRSPGKLAVTANITIPGASGFSIGQIFWIGRTYEHYKKEGAFQLFGLTENIDMSRGWTTEIYARFNAIPKSKVATLTPV